jgi:uncharacterized membrane protein YfcA
MTLDLWHANASIWAGLCAVFVLAGLVKGVVGLGLPTVSMALMALWLPPAEAAALLLVPSFVTNVWQLTPWAGVWSVLRRLAAMQAGIVLGTWAGAMLFGVAASAWSGALLGVALVAYGLWGLTGRQATVPPGRRAWFGAVAGAITGMVTATTGVFVIPAVPYLQALGLTRDELIQAMGLSFTTSTLALAVVLAGDSHLDARTLGTSLVMLLPVIGGMAAGQALRRRLSGPLFRRCFFLGLAALGAYMVIEQITH